MKYLAERIVRAAKVLWLVVIARRPTRKEKVLLFPVFLISLCIAGPFLVVLARAPVKNDPTSEYLYPMF